MTDDAWTLYWSNNTPQSCIASQDSSDAKAIDALWRDFVANLKPGATILDLATGNGAVPRAMLRERQNYSITAVDRADIAPLKYLKDPGNLQQVRFIGGIDASQLPMADQSYDALSSQFGIEYGDLNAIAAEVSRVIKPGGRCQFLMHHSDSAIVSPNALLIGEFENCLKKGGLVDALLAFLQGQCSAADLDQKGQRYLASDNRKTRQVSGQLFEGISIVLKTADNDMGEASGIAANMVARLKAEYTRLVQMQNASLNAEGIGQFTQKLTDTGLLMEAPEALTIGAPDNKALIGWLLKGHKP